ncbi:hypothetical protein Peur_044815 [Populus x canadensis]
MPLFLLSTMTKKSSWVGEAELKRKGFCFSSSKSHLSHFFAFLCSPLPILIRSSFMLEPLHELVFEGLIFIVVFLFP